MAWLDVDDVTLDPMLSEPIVVVRRQQGVNKFGEVSISSTNYNTYGTVVPVTPNSLIREEAYEFQRKSLRVFTRFALQGVAKDSKGNDYQPDLVLWHGDYYIVKTINDYTSWGPGMVEADCSSIDYVDQPPQPPA